MQIIQQRDLELSYTILSFSITIVSVEEIKLNRGGRHFEYSEGVGCNCILDVMPTLYKKICKVERHCTAAYKMN